MAKKKKVPKRSKARRPSLPDRYDLIGEDALLHALSVSDDDLIAGLGHDAAKASRVRQALHKIAARNPEPMITMPARRLIAVYEMLGDLLERFARTRA